MVGTLKNKEEVASGTLSVTFEVKEPFIFKAGQFCFITLENLLFPDSRGIKRHFSIVNSPNQKGIITFTTRASESGFKRTLKELAVGTTVELGPIKGDFVLPEDTTRPLVFIAGGIGITPFMSMLKYISEEKLAYKITLIYSNKNRRSAAYLEELQNYQLQTTRFADSARQANYKLILTMTDDPAWSGEKRKVDSNFIKEYFPNVNAQNYMVVGPQSMVEAVEKALLEAGVLSENIKKENFTGYVD